MWKWGDPRRLAYAVGSSPAVSAQYSFVSLYNNSTGPHVLCIHDLATDPLDQTNPEGFALAYGVIGTGSAATIPAFGDTALTVGLVNIGSVASLPANIVPDEWQTYYVHTAERCPIAFIPPGWSFTAYGNQLNQSYNTSIMYEWRWIWEFPVIPTSPTDG